MCGTKMDNRFRAVKGGLCAVVACADAGLINIIGIIIGDKAKLF
jgi:hypothetical protein